MFNDIKTINYFGNEGRHEWRKIIWCCRIAFVWHYNFHLVAREDWRRMKFGNSWNNLSWNILKSSLNSIISSWSLDTRCSWHNNHFKCKAHAVCKYATWTLRRKPDDIIWFICSLSDPFNLIFVSKQFCADSLGYLVAVLLLSQHLNLACFVMIYKANTRPLKLIKKLILAFMHKAWNSW